MSDKLYFAIGDIHGELDRLKALHTAARAHAREHFPHMQLVFVHLGDLVDRGADSCGVIEYLILLHGQAPETITLMGNHEQMMLDSYPDGQAEHDPSWLRWGGMETLDSYHKRGLDHPPETHLQWIANLPDIVEVGPERFVFVHAGVHPQEYPTCSAQLHLWTRRRDFLDPENWLAADLQGATVVHGHTPTENSEPDVVAGPVGTRINVDTGAVYGGQLTGVGLVPGGERFFLHT